jgi:hypothetical protein
MPATADESLGHPGGLFLPTSGAWIVINCGGRNKNSVLEHINHATHIRAARQEIGKNEWSK